MGQYHVDQYSIIEVPEKKREKGAESLIEGIMSADSPNLGKETDI